LISSIAWQVAALLCLRDIADGMAYLHSLGLMHTDLKGANVLLKSCTATALDPRGYKCKVRIRHLHDIMHMP
jgi:serine/threonine protein kinase